MLNNLKLERTYESLFNDIAEEFYIPCLSNSIIYKRVAGFFSSAALSQFSVGLSELFKNGGKYQLIISNEISEYDYNLIKEGYELKELFSGKITSINFEYNQLDIEQKKDFSNLAYLISIGFVEIKIGFSHKGLFHSKFGIFKDRDKNGVYFSGSNNETAAAFQRNYESFTVIESWASEKDGETIEIQEKRFDNLWNNTVDNSIILVKEFNELLKTELISYSKGKLVMDSIFFEEDALILYYEKEKLKVLNRLKSERNIESVRQMRRIKNKYLIDGEFWNFSAGLNYGEIEDIIKNLTRACKRVGVRLVISDSVYNFVDSQKFEIDKISRRGLMLKNKDQDVNDEFLKFKEIVDKNTSRPLRDIQMWVSFYMANMRRVGNFSVPGAGKTAMVYGTFAYLNSEEISQADNMVVIGPKNSFKSWKDEFINVFGSKKNIEVLDVHSPYFRKEMFTKHLSNYNLFLINYESLKKYKSALKSIISNRTILVFDEVHRIKGLKSVRAHDAIEIAQKSKFRYLLTGTPIPNGYQDLWNMLQIMYMDEHRQYFNVTKSELQNITETRIKEFNDSLFPFYWRVTKNELDVPMANPNHLISTSMTANEQEVVNLLWRKYYDKPFILYARLIQFTSNPQLLKANLERTLFTSYEEDIEEEMLTFEYKPSMFDKPSFTQDELNSIDRIGESSKFLKAIDFASELIDNKKVIIIWCIFVNTMHKITKKLGDRGYKVALIYGDIDSYERERILTDFQKGLYDVLITNPHTLGESVSLHNIAHDALYLEYSFNLTHMLQSRDRIHRLGLKDSDETNYYYFILEGNDDFRNTIDRKIYERLKEKEEIMIEAIESTHIGPEVYFNESKEILDLMKTDR